MKTRLMKSMLFTVLLAVGLAGCGGGNNSGNDASSPASSSGSSSGGGTQEITVNASNFKFEPNEIHVKKGDKVKLTLNMKEGNHGFNIPDYNVDIKGNGSAEFTADKAGTFDFQCSVMCGSGHANMKGKLIVDE